MTYFGSSKFMQRHINFTGILSKDPALNPGTPVHTPVFWSSYIYDFLCLHIYIYIYLYIHKYV
jgi:hypothetical protein